MPGMVGTYGRAPYSALAGAGTAGISAPIPYVESDKSSRTAAILEGIGSVITSASDAYARLRYNPRPINPELETRPNSWYGSGFSLFGGDTGEPMPGSSRSAFAGISGGGFVVLAIIGLALFLMLRK